MLWGYVVCSGHSCFLSHFKLWKAEKIKVVSGLSLTMAVRWEEDIWPLGSTALKGSLTALTSNLFLFPEDLSSYYINNKCMWLLILHIPPCSLAWKTFVVAADLFPLGVYFSCESCSGCSSVRKQNFPIIIQRSWLAPSDHAAACRDRWWVWVFLPKAIFAALSVVVLKITWLLEWRMLTSDRALLMGGCWRWAFG